MKIRHLIAATLTASTLVLFSGSAFAKEPAPKAEPYPVVDAQPAKHAEAPKPDKAAPEHKAAPEMKMAEKGKPAPEKKMAEKGKPAPDKKMAEKGKPAPHGKVVTVKPGDTLSRIAKRYHVSVAKLKRLNHLKSNTLFAGQKLRLG